MSYSRGGKNYFLMLGGVLSSLAALLHIAIIIGGADWYRYFGAGAEMVEMAESGSMFPAIITFFIAIVFSVWALYAFSGADLMRRLPLLRPVLIIIALIYLVRGLAIIPIQVATPEMVDNFLIWSSVISTLYGFTYAMGIGLAWKELGERRRGERREQER